MSNHYTPPTTSPNYMSSDWGSTKTKETTMKIDHIADKAEFAISMLESALNGFDVIEKEIVDISNATALPTREQIRAMAYRIDNNQNQLRNGLAQVKQFMRDIDSATDNIQKVKTSW